MSTAGVIGIKITGDSSALQQELDNAGRKVREFGGKVAEQSSAIERLATGLKSAFVGSSIAVGIITLKNLVGDATQAIIEAQIQVDKLRNGFNFAVGRDKAASELVFVQQAAHSLGLELVGTSQQYMKLAASTRGTALEGQKTRDMFNAIAKASVVMGLSAEESEGAFRAVVQMVSKGKVTAEELRGQFGEQIPGAMQIAARAIGVTTGELDKMMELGQLGLPELYKIMMQMESEVAPEVNAASQSMQASTNRLSNAWTLLKQNIAQSGAGDAIAYGAGALSNDLQAMSDAMANARASGAGFFTQWGAGFGMLIGRAMGLQAVMDAFKTNAQRVQAMSVDLSEARGRLVQLQEVQSRSPSIYLTREIERTQGYIRVLEAAIARQKQLAEGPRASFRAGDNASLSAMAEMQTADRKLRDELMVAASGQAAGFQKSLSDAYALFRRGGMTEAEYTGYVRSLIDKSGGVSKPKEPGFGPRDTAQRLAELRLAASAVEQEVQALKQKRDIERELQLLRLRAATGEASQDYMAARRAQLQMQELDAQEAGLRTQLAQAQAAEASARREDDKVQALTKRLGIEKRLEELGIRRLQIDDGEIAFLEAVRKSEEAVKNENVKRDRERRSAGVQAGLDMSDEARQMRISMLPASEQASAILAREASIRRAIVSVNYKTAEESRQAWEGFYDWFNERSAQLAREYISGADAGIQAYLRTIQDAGRATAEAAQRSAQSLEGGILDALKGSSAGIKRWAQQAADDILTLRIVRPIMAELFGGSMGGVGYGGSAIGGMGVALFDRLFGGGFPTGYDMYGGATGMQNQALMSMAIGGTHALGMPYIPYDNYPALLHRGERVLTADENRARGDVPGGGGNTYIFNGGVSRSEVMAGLQQARVMAVADVIDGQARRRF